MPKKEKGCKPPKCFKCEKEVEGAISTRDPAELWNSPEGIVLQGGGNFGSAVYDGMVDGIYIQVVICDDCLRAHKGLLREVHRPEATFGGIYYGTTERQRRERGEKGA